jgi:hypothetical protein
MSPKLQARIAGLFYLVVVVASVFALSCTSNLTVPNDATATAANILANEQMFRIGFVANLIACGAYVVVVAMLYVLMKPAGATLAVVSAFLGLAGCAISGATMLNQIAVLVWLGDAAYLNAFQPDQLHALARVHLRLSGIGNSLGLFFFGCYCLTLAGLVFRAAFIPRILGGLLTIAGLGWLANALVTFLAPSLAGAVSPLTMASGGLGEGLFTLWLLVMGVNAEKWRTQAAAARQSERS